MLCEQWQLSTVILKPPTALFYKINENCDSADKPQQGTRKKLRYPPIRALIVVEKITRGWQMIQRTEQTELVYDLLIVQLHP